MADISLIEWGVYGFIAYSSMLMLIISTVKDVPSQRSGSIIRSIYLIPGIICAFILAGSGVNIITEDVTITNLNTTETFTESREISLQDPVWMTVHMLIGIVLIIYVIQQTLILLTKT